MNPLLFSSIIEIAKTLLTKKFKSSEEKQKAEVTLDKLKEQPQLLQLMIDLSESQKKSLFISGWHAFLGWGLASLFLIGIAYDEILFPILKAYHLNCPPIDISLIITMLGSLLGIGGLGSLTNLAKNKFFKS